MRIVLIWIMAILINLVIISPFFWLWFLRKKVRWLHIASSSILSLIFYFLYIYKGSDKILDLFAKINANAYYFYYDAESTGILFVPFLMIISPFIFTKIIYGKITKKHFFISLAVSILIVAALVLIFAYYIFPKAAESLLINI